MKFINEVPWGAAQKGWGLQKIQGQGLGDALRSVASGESPAPSVYSQSSQEGWAQKLPGVFPTRGKCCSRFSQGIRPASSHSLSGSLAPGGEAKARGEAWARPSGSLWIEAQQRERGPWGGRVEGRRLPAGAQSPETPQVPRLRAPE